MKKLPLILFSSILFIASCKDKTTPQPVVEDGIQAGEELVVDNTNVTGTLNVDGGILHVEGDGKVSADINLDQELGGELYIQDNAVIHKINMDNGVAYITGSPIIENDFNLNNGTVYFGAEDSPNTDTVRIKSQFNISDTVFVLGGVLLIESNMNLTGGVISVSPNAKVIVSNDLNQGGDMYGVHRILVLGHENHNSGIRNILALEEIE